MNPKILNKDSEMREIKFRVWQNDDEVKRMLYPSDMVDYCDLVFIPTITKMIPRFHCNYQGYVPPYKFELMQYTGLKDKNDVEIYEGDILIHEDFEHKKDKVVGVMEWDEKVAGFTRFYPLNKFEVIGNIFENPKLVKE